MAITNISWYAKHDHDTVQENFTIQRESDYMYASKTFPTSVQICMN